MIRQNAVKISAVLTAAWSAGAVLTTVRKVKFILLFPEGTISGVTTLRRSDTLLPVTVLSERKFTIFTGYDRRQRIYTQEDGKMKTKADGSTCPFVRSPFPDCYCFNMTSKNIDSAIIYCGNKYKECRIYHNNFLLKRIVAQKALKTL
jgi:hypothetical protein